jgi:hypothetical protein
MAHAQKLTEQVKSLTSRVHELETALRGTSNSGQSSSHVLLSDASTLAGGDAAHEEEDDIYEAIGSLSIGLDGQTKYHGESASSEVSRIPHPLVLRGS